MHHRNLHVSILIIALSISRCFTIPMTRMRVCVQSTDPLRLQSQCVYCNNRMFAPTVRQCTGNTYLPANLSVEEAFCLVRNCRRQMPMMRPEPFYGTPYINSINTGTSINSVNTGDNDDDDYPNSDALYEEQPITVAPKKRPPAHISVGRPQRPQRPIFRPFLFG